MNIIGVLADQVKKWNRCNTCDLCWVFAPGGRPDYFNNVKLRDDGSCCVYLGVLDIRNTSRYEQNSLEITEKRYCDWNVRLIAGIPSRLDIQFHNENESIPSSEGKWEKYISKIFACLSSCCVEFDLCDVLGCEGKTTVDVLRWDLEMVMNYKDLNLDGVIVNATFREYV